MCPIWELSHQTMQRGAGPKDSGTGVSGTQVPQTRGASPGCGPYCPAKLPWCQLGEHGLQLGGTLGTLTPTCLPTSPRAVKMAWDECGHACAEQVFAEMKGEVGESPHPITPDDGMAPAVQDRWGRVCAERGPREAAGDPQGPPARSPRGPHAPTGVSPPSRAHTCLDSKAGKKEHKASANCIPVSFYLFFCSFFPFFF